MKLIVTSFFLFCTLSAQAAAVLWNEGFDFRATSSPDPEYGLVYAGMVYRWGDNDEIYNSFGWEIELVGDSERRMAADEVDVGRGIRVITAEVGDVINHEASQDMSRVFVTNYGDGSLNDLVRIRYNGDNPVTLYFGIEAAVWGETPYAPADWDHRVYGWFELFVDNYTMTLGNTCLDLSGRPVIVGVRPEEPIPEPASGALALLGATLLFRRRRNWVWQIFVPLPPR